MADELNMRGHLFFFPEIWAGGTVCSSMGLSRYEARNSLPNVVFCEKIKPSMM